MNRSSLRPDERGLVLVCPQGGRTNRPTYERLGHKFRCGGCKTSLPVPDVPVEIPDAASFSALTGRSALPVLVDFWASWSGPCRMVAPELVKVAQAGARRWIVVKVNTEELPDLAAQHGISRLSRFRSPCPRRRPARAILKWLINSGAINGKFW